MKSRRKISPFTFSTCAYIIISWLFSLQATANSLKNHASPYLSMHGNDPINWMEWGSAAIEKARKENKLLFVSIGYYACYWCHVMHRESYSNAEIAQKLNRDYVPVKVDRELNPVLDKRLIEFVSATNGTAGWPLNVFITPEGYPLVGATYIPKSSFSEALTDLAQQWKSNHNKLAHDARDMNEKLTDALNDQEIRGRKKHLTENSNTLLSDIMSSADTLQGGLGEQMKFPSSPQLAALLEINRSRKRKDIDAFIKLTLDTMASKGLHDEIAGGFFRYTVDQGWHTPHFEKMLYNNAMLPILYLDAADYYQQPAYRKVALETLHFLQQNMLNPNQGAFIASLSAVDDHGIEGGYYLWTQQQLRQILSPEELKLANTAWEMDQQAEMDAGNLPMLQGSLESLAKRLGQPADKLDTQLKQIKNKLKNYRQKHRKLPQDTKLLTAWNGLALAAFARALSSDTTLKPTGDKLAHFLVTMWNGKNLKRSADTDKPGTLGDYAAAAWGLLSWARASHNTQARNTGIKLLEYAWQHFYKNHKWQESEKQLLPEGVLAAHLTDSPYPSAETLLIRASFLANVPTITARARQVLSYSTKSVESNPFSYASLIATAHRYPSHE